MAKRIFGKTFYTAEEAEALGLTMDPEELARADQALEEFDRIRAKASPILDDEQPFGGNFSNDLVGTPYEGWTREQLEELGETHDAKEIDVLGNVDKKHQ